MMMVCIYLLLLTGCIYSKEAKRLKNSEEVQTEIEAAIKEQAQQKYGIDVDGTMQKLRFTVSEGTMFLPIKSDRWLDVTVQTLGSPTDDIILYLAIYDR